MAAGYALIHNMYNAPKVKRNASSSETFINPKRLVSEDAFKIHGYSEEFLSDKKTFAEIADGFLNFIKGKKIIIHNAGFDLSFLNYELKLAGKKNMIKDNIVDTLEIARQKYPGSQNSLDALCKRFHIDNRRRTNDLDKTLS